MLNDAIWEHIDKFTKATKTSDIQQLLERFSHQMGFDYFRLLIIFPISMQKSHVALFNNCPTTWFDAYSENQYLTQDPVVYLGLKQTQPIFWNKLDCDSPWLPSASRDVMNLAADFGVRNGVSFPLHTPQGEHGILSFITKENINGHPTPSSIGVCLHWSSCRLHSCSHAVSPSVALPAPAVGSARRHVAVQPLTWSQRT